MARWFSILLFALLVLPGGGQAQTGRLSVLASGQGIMVTPTTSTSYIEVTGRDAQDAQTFQHRCEPNATCVAPNVAGTASISSRLVYDGTRERLTNCNGQAPTSEGAACMSSGLLTATTQLRMGRLKISAKPDAGFSGLNLNTANRKVILEFLESSQDAWQVGYSNSNTGIEGQYQKIPAGSYRVRAEDLLSHCHASQTNSDLTIAVPEYASEADQREIVVLFRGNQCDITIERSAVEGVNVGTIVSTPEGLSCPIGGARCTGSFAFGTQVTFVPSGSYSWSSGQGCSTSNAPCNWKVSADRVFELQFLSDVSTGEDAGSGPAPDSGAANDPDSGTSQEDAGAQSDAGSAKDAGSSAPDPQEEEDGSGGSDGCALAPSTGSQSACWLLLALGSVLVVRSRKRRS